MKESLWVVNTKKEDISLNLHSAQDTDALMAMSKHKAKRALKASCINIRIPGHKKLDLVSASGVKLEDIKKCADYNFFIRKGVLKVVVETHIVIVEDEDVEVDLPVELEELSSEDIEIVEEPEESNLIEEAIKEEAPAPVFKKSKKGVASFKKSKKE